MSFAQRERQLLVAQMRAVGPDAPTLCGGWTVRDLAAHLLIRERRPDASPGILIPGLAKWTQRVQDRVAAGEWDVMLDRIAAGPPVWSPLRAVDRFVNSLEMFAHHEDIRRGQSGWQPRDLGSDQRELMRMLSLAKNNYRKAPVRVELSPAGGQTVTIGRPDAPTVRLAGAPGELVLHAVGRSAVEVDFEGAPDDIAALNATKRGI